MAPLNHTDSFSSQAPLLSSSQYLENYALNPIEGIRRVTIRQLLTATESESKDTKVINIEGFAVKRVMLVANIFGNVTDPSTGKITYRLDDGTGRINGSRWPLKAVDPPIAEFAYARIVAELEVYKSYRTLKVQHVRPVHDGHEIYHHILHVILDTLCLEKGPPIYPPSKTAIDVNDLTQVIQRIDISENKPSSSGTRLSRQPTELTDEPPVASSSRIIEPASTSGRPKNLPLEQDILTCLIDKELDNHLGVHVADFIPDIKDLHPALTSAELSATLEDLIDRRLITAVQNGEYFRCI